ncbi:1-phosphofructokinase [Paludibacterium purpuratum]|uniref:Phosphofructokinase n=1 Tax=Paludibacterium purpuratum TaxID=1144873 RepID=A0A4V3DVR0_9NEIS|nr:1-phosphofructokinase [Paludibacterium purpuratum]TDR81949.1 fructose-1-phosphate kinase [Paludibacterium purpuratum]
MKVPVITVTLNPAIDQTIRLQALAHGAVNLALGVDSHPGGKGVNVASCLADGGTPVVATGILGRDNLEPFTKLFLDKGIDNRFTLQPGSTRVNIKLVTADDHSTTEINLPGATVLPTTFAAWLERMGELGEPGRFVVLSGSLPGGLPDDCYAALCARLAAERAYVVLDTSGEPLCRALAGTTLPYCIKPNRHELAQWAGRELPTLNDVIEEAHRLYCRGVCQVVVSLAEQGALFVGAPGVWHARMPALAPMSTVGAGDALLAGWLAAQHAGRDWEAAIRLAMAFASGKLTRIGPHLPDRATIEQLAREVMLAPV